MTRRFFPLLAVSLTACGGGSSFSSNLESFVVREAVFVRTPLLPGSHARVSIVLSDTPQTCELLQVQQAPVNSLRVELKSSAGAISPGAYAVLDDDLVRSGQAGPGPNYSIVFLTGPGPNSGARSGMVTLDMFDGAHATGSYEVEMASRQSPETIWGRFDAEPCIVP